MQARVAGHCDRLPKEGSQHQTCLKPVQGAFGQGSQAHGGVILGCAVRAQELGDPCESFQLNILRFCDGSIATAPTEPEGK